MKLLFYAFLFFSSSVLFAQDHELDCFIKDPDGRYREHQVDFEKMILEVAFEPTEAKVLGKVNYAFTPIQPIVDTLFLDAPGIRIDYVWLNQKEVPFRSNDEGLIISFDEALLWGKDYELEIGYIAYPEKGIYFLGWDDETNRLRKQIWTQGQGIDNRHWIPSFDGVTDKLVTETIIHFETGYEVVSNGNLESTTDNEDGTTTWHYAMTKPHVMYLVMLAIGEYDYMDMTAENGVVSRQYYYPDRPEAFAPTYQYSNDMMDWLEAELGVPYPWEIYRNVPVQDFLYGAMENTTATIFTDYYVQDERAALARNYIGTNAHELTHQWFGDYVTEWSGTHHWLHESFATHYAKHFERQVHGEDAFNWKRRQEMTSAWNASKKNNLPIAHTNAGSARHYPKGSIVIDMMRYVVGEDAFHKVIQSFLEKHPYGHVDSHLFYLSFMETTGINLDWFFNEWVYKGGEPEYNVSYTASDKGTHFNVAQVHAQDDNVGLFKMPIVFQVHYRDGSSDELTSWVEEEQSRVTVPNVDGKEIAYTLFDPNYQVLKKVNFDKSIEEWQVQLVEAEHMIDRYDALLALRDVEAKDKRLLLISHFYNEPFWGIRAEIVKQLVNDDHKKSQQLIAKALKDEAVEVRQAIIQHVDKIPSNMLGQYEQLLEDPSYVVTELATKKLIADFPNKETMFLQQIENEIGHNHNLAITFLSYKAKNDVSAVNKLIDFTGKSFEFRTRIKAMDVIEGQDIFNKDLVANLIHAGTHFNRRLRSSAVKLLKAYATDSVRKQTIVSALQDWDATEQENKRAEILLSQIEEI